MDSSNGQSDQENMVVEGEVSPPSFEELPLWFQDEINDKNDRLGVDKDIRESHTRRHKKKVIYVGAILNVLILYSQAPLGFLPTLFMSGCGALTGYLILRLESSPPTGIFIAALVNLPAFFAFSNTAGISGMNALPFFVACLFFAILGLVLTLFVTSERLENLPF